MQPQAKELTKISAILGTGDARKSGSYYTLSTDLNYILHTYSCTTLNVDINGLTRNSRKQIHPKYMHTILTYLYN